MTNDKTSIRGWLNSELTKTRIVLIALGILVVATLPNIAGQIDSLSYRSIYSGMTFGLAAIGVGMLIRHLGLVSFGHAAFFGASAYTIAVLTTYLHVSNLFVLLFSGVFVALVLSCLAGYLVKSHLAIFFSLLTLAFNQIIYAVVKSSEFFNFSDGLGVRIEGQRPDVFGVELGLESYNLFMHYLTVFFLIVGLFTMWKIGRSPFGRTMSAIGQNRVRANFIGIRVERYVWAAFVISGIYAGIGGGLFALYELHIRPGPTLHIFRSGEMLFMSILGGVETISGPVIGGVVLRYLLDTMYVFTEHFDLVTGVLLIAVVFLLPDGLLGANYQKIASMLTNPIQIISWLKSILSNAASIFNK